MFLIIETLFLCIFVVGAKDISFKGITVFWELDNSSKGTQYVSSSNNLKENLLNTFSKIRVGVKSGSIPVLYENSVSDIKNLEELTLNSVNLQEIRPRAFKNVQIRYLSLASNKITKLSGEIFENVKLDILDLVDNRISKIEAGVFSGVKLSRLRLPYNELEEIKPNVFNIPDLKMLVLHNNKIKTLQAEDLQNLPKLEHLDLSSNKLKTIVEGTFQNSILEELQLGANEISLIDSKSFDNMTKLRSIYLGLNNLTEWDKNWFYNTPSLRSVYFNSNSIKEIPDGAFQNLDEVTILHLYGNKMSKFSPNTFVKNDGNGKVKIGILYLNGNNLTCIEGPLKDVFGSVDHVNLESNPWDENCENKAIDISNLWQI